MAKVILQKQDLTYLQWSKIRNSSGTAGSFLKAYSDFSDRKKYYKLSNFDSEKGIVGHESVNELIVDRLLDIFDVPHLSYELIHADVQIDNKVYETYLCASYDYKEKGEDKIALDEYYEVERFPSESKLDFCIRNHWEEYIYTMLAVDFIIMNRDRHGANIEVLRNPKKKTLRIAPLFDHGISLFYQCQSEKDYETLHIDEEKRVQCFFTNSSTARDNLCLIPKTQLPRLGKLVESDKKRLFMDLEDCLDSRLMDAIWNMIWRRYKEYEDLYNQK